MDGLTWEMMSLEIIIASMLSMDRQAREHPRIFVLMVLDRLGCSPVAISNMLVDLGSVIGRVRPGK